MRRTVMLQFLFTGVIWTGVSSAYGGELFQVGGLLFSDPDNILGSPIVGAQIDVDGPNGSFTTFSADLAATVPGLWAVADVPEGLYTVSVQLNGWCFEVWDSGASRGPPPINIEVNQATQGAIGSLNFLGQPGAQCAQGSCQMDRDCNDRDPCTDDTCDNNTCVFTPMMCPAGQSCDPGTGQCHSLGFCAFPPVGDADCDGLDDATDDPCVGPPGTDNTLNRCTAAGVATCGTADPPTSFQNCVMGEPLRLNIGGVTSSDCLGDPWTAEINSPSGDVSNGNVVTDAGILTGLLGCSDAVTQAIVQTGRFDDPINRAYPIANGTYIVNLLLAENFDKACVSGARAFDISVEGQVIEVDFDQHDVALSLNGLGCGSVVVRSVIVTITDNALNFNLDASINNAIFKAFEVLAVAECDDDDACPTGTQCSTFACVDSACIPVAADDGTPCDDDDACTTQDACTSGSCGGDAIDCGGGVCNPSTGLCSGFCAFPPAGDMDCDGLDDATDDPCVGPPGLDNTMNRCAAEVALCAQAPPGTQDCAAGEPLRLDLGAAGDTQICNGEIWAVETPGSGNTSAGNVTVDSVAVAGLFGCTDGPTGALVLSQRWFDPLTRAYPLANGTYVINLLFAENFDEGCDAGAGFRVFDITIEGVPRVPAFDQFATALALNGNGCGSPVVRSLFVDIEDEVLDILLDPSANNGALKAIEVLGPLGCSLDDDCPTSMDPCTTFTCIAGACAMVNADDGTACNDDDACTTDDMCAAGRCSGSFIDCTDNDVCTDDTCVDGVCSNEPIDCSDGDLCTLDHCTDPDGCSNTPIDCPAGESCDSSTGQCLPAPAFCAVPPVGDMDCDGLDDVSNDPCVGPAGPVNTFNRCQATIAQCADSGGTQQCAAGTDLRLNLGGPQATDCAGNTWLAETNPTGMASAGNVAAESTIVTGLFGCTDPVTESIVLSTRFAAPLNRAYPVEDGTYIVNMLFSEAFSGRGTGCDGGIGWRVFDIAVEDTTLYSDFDQFATGLGENLVGCGSPVVRSAVVTVSDGSLDLSLTPSADNGALKAVEVLRVTGCTIDDDCPAMPDTCSISTCIDGTCERTTAPDGAACDDGDKCTTADQCVMGVCLGAPLDCIDGDACTTDDCVDGTCVNEPIDCNDGDACTTDGCTNGGCVLEPIDCDDLDPCTLDSCLDGICSHDAVDCGDGNPCTVDGCEGGECTNEPIAGCCLTDKGCDDRLECTIDQCISGVCNNEPIAKCCEDAAECDDGDVCTADDCIGNTCAHDAIPECCEADIDCDDFDACTTDTCTDNTCVNESVPDCCVDVAECDDGDACTADDCTDNICVNVDIPGCCVDATDCDDGDVCTTDDCDGACINDPIANCCLTEEDCDDSNLCTTDMCTKNRCVNEPILDCCTIDFDCDDDDACTEDVCIRGACLNKPIGACCNETTDCDDDDPCTEDACIDHTCLHKPDGGCCNGPEECVDGDACTIDTCDDNVCTHAPLDCDDMNSCTTDACVAGDCLNEPLPGCCVIDEDCIDGSMCTTDICVDGTCMHEPIADCCKRDIDCDDADRCTVDTCVAGTCIFEHTPDCCRDDIECDDGIPCTVDTCFQDTCFNLDTVCPDGEVCNTVTGGCGLPCGDLGDCADMDGDTIRDDNCVWWDCTAGGTCASIATVFADLGGFLGDCPPDGVSDGNDTFHVLNCFADQDTSGPGSEYPCENLPSPFAYNVDAGGVFGDCQPDGVCDGGDVFHVLAAFGKTTPCTCSDGGPTPQAPPIITERTTLVATRSVRRVRPGHVFDVDVRLGSGIEDLRGYQLHFDVSGGRRGHVAIIDIAIEDRPDAAFAGRGPLEALNVFSGQLFSGLQGPGIEVAAGAYLATITIRVSDDAAGRFSIDLLHDDHDPQARTFLFATPMAGKIAVDGSTAVTIDIDAGRRGGSLR